MPILATGNTFATGDSPTAATLNAAVNSASFAAGAVDNSTTLLSGGSIIVRDGGITPAKLSTGAPSWTGAGVLSATSIQNTPIGATTPSTGAFTSLSASGLTSVYEVIEKATLSGATLTGTVNYDILSGAVVYFTANAGANWTLNLRASSGATLNSIMATNDAVTVVVLATQGATAYYPTAHTIDGNAVTPKWSGGTAPSAGNASSIDSYVYTIIKTGSAAFTVLASQTRFA